MDRRSGGTAAGKHVVIIAAFHEPDHDLARRLIASLLGQSDVDVNIVAVLDGQVTASDTVIGAMLADERIITLAMDEPRGVRGAFAAGLARGLALYPGDDVCFAYADQDDLWRADKLQQLLRVLNKDGISLARCDARVITRDGMLIAASLHAFEHRQDPRDLLEALLLNSISGMTALFTAATARLAVKLMTGLDSTLLHDHVTAVAAAALGRIASLDQPLVDYVQHDGNVLGARQLRQRRFYERSFRRSDITAYRATTQRIFEDRRAVAMALQAAGLLEPQLQDMFVTASRSTALWRMIWLYDAAFLRMCFGGQLRRGLLCIRLLDAALRHRLTNRTPV